MIGEPLRLFHYILHSYVALEGKIKNLLKGKIEHFRLVVYYLSILSLIFLAKVGGIKKLQHFV